MGSRQCSITMYSTDLYDHVLIMFSSDMAGTVDEGSVSDNSPHNAGFLG